MTGLETANHILQQAAVQSGTDLSGLVGEPIDCSAADGTITSPAEFSTQVKGPVVLSEFEIGGDYAGKCFLGVGVKAAIILGGKLIMLPADELEARVKSNKFDGELPDAFNEISNILTGTLNSVFEPGVPNRLHFKKTSVKLEKPPFPSGVIPGLGEGPHHLTTVEIEMAGEKVGSFWLLLPVEALKIDTTEAEEQMAANSAASAQKSAAAPEGRAGTPSPPLVVVVADEPAEREQIAALLATREIRVLKAGVQDDLRNLLADQDVAGALLVMREVGDIGFAAEIKLRSVIKPTIPLIAAGPAWTKKAVLQAVKYGACDILITPVSAEELLEKLRTYQISFK